jgi:hypothetical protein
VGLLVGKLSQQQRRRQDGETQTPVETIMNSFPPLKQRGLRIFD